MLRAIAILSLAGCAFGQTCTYQTGKFPNGQVMVYRNGSIQRQGPDFSFKVTAGVPVITPINWAPADKFSTVFSIKVPLTLPDGTAYSSFRPWQENWDCPGVALPPASVPIFVESGTITAGVELVSDAPNMEIPIMTNIPGERRYEMVTVCSTVRFMGQTRVQVAIGRPGTNHLELTGTFAPMENADNNSNCWTARPSIPQLIGPYDLVAYFEVFTQDGNGNEIPGSINKLSGGQMTWEIAYFGGKIGSLGVSGLALNSPVFQCSGSGSHVDPKTGNNIGWDCAGLLWAKLPNASIVGVSMVPPSDLVKWTQVAK